MLWIALHVPWLSLEAFMQTLSSDVAGQVPVALLDGHQVSAADPIAQALGVKPGMKRATALALAPDLLFGQANTPRDAQALGAVAQAVLAFTPSVTLEGSHTVLMEVQGSLRLFGGLPRLLRRVQAAIAPLHHLTRIATAPTAGGAALLAAWRDDLTLGIHSTDRTALGRLLDDAPIWLVGRGREHWEGLQGMGLRHLSDLRHLPRTGLARRFGPDLLLDLDRAHGDAPDPRQWVPLPRCFEARIELFARADHSEQLLHVARGMLQRLIAWAGAWHARIAAFTLRLHHETRLHPASRTAVDDPPAFTPLPIVLGLACADAAHLHTLLAERLARLVLPAPVLEIELSCDDLVDTPAPNGELFNTRASEHEGLLRLIDRLQARLGSERVRRLQAVPDHRPERDTIEVPAHGPAPRSAGRAGDTSHPALPGAPGANHLIRPIWLLPQPQPLRETRAAGPLLQGHPLKLLTGPERIETGWWDGDVVTRDYFIAQTTDDALVWIYRERVPDVQAAPGWFLHGRFA